MDCRVVLFTAAIAVLGSGCARSTHAQNQGPATDQLNAIATTLRNDGVERIETLHIPLGQETFGDITPKTLQSGWHYKSTIRNLPIASRDALAEALTTASVRLDSGSIDLRQGVIFYSSKDGMPFGAIYFDKSGHRGIVNSTPVSFETDLLSRLRKILPLSFE